MKKIQFKIMFSTIVFASMLMVAVSINAAPVKFKQVVQVVNAKPGKAGTANFSKLRVVSDPVNLITDGDGDGDDKKKKTAETTPQDGRVITITTAEITENTEEACLCDDVLAIGIERGGFPKWPLFGLGAVPLAFIKTPEDGPTPTPTPTPPTTGTPTPTPTTATPTPQEPIPEPMTLLLFGTGLAGVGLAARKRFGKKTEGEEETESVE